MSNQERTLSLLNLMLLERNLVEKIKIYFLKIILVY